jgi:hypothetical protein
MSEVCACLAHSSLISLVFFDTRPLFGWVFSSLSRKQKCMLQDGKIFIILIWLIVAGVAVDFRFRPNPSEWILIYSGMAVVMSQFYLMRKWTTNLLKEGAILSATLLCMLFALYALTGGELLSPKLTIVISVGLGLEIGGFLALWSEQRKRNAAKPKEEPPHRPSIRHEHTQPLKHPPRRHLGRHENQH